MIHAEPQAPQKPVPGAACNGCGVCCLVEPCPLGVLLSGRRSGACVALRWQGDGAIYRCGALSDRPAVLREVAPAWAQGLSPLFDWLLQQWGTRWIAVGSGCDCTLQVELCSGTPDI
jgi:hypothetical protein